MGGEAEKMCISDRCGDRISPGMAGEKEMAERLGIPVRSVSMEEIQSMELSPTEGMGMSMG